MVQVIGQDERDEAKIVFALRQASEWINGQTAPLLFGYINKFRNGTLDVWQRGTSALASAATTVNGYQADGWIINATFSSGAGPVMSQAANNRTGALTQWALKILGATNVTDVILKQRIEGAVAAAFGTQTVTLQARVFNNTGGSITPTLTVKYPTATDNYSATTTDGTASAVSLQACADGAWTQVAYTFTPSGTVSLGMEVAFDLGNNFSSGAKNVNVTELDIRATPGVTLGLNSSPPGPELRSIEAELAFCQSYYATSYGNTIAPGTVTRLGAVFTACNTGTAIQAYASVTFPVSMRAAPTMSWWDSAGNANKLSYLPTTGVITWTDNSAANGGTPIIGKTGFAPTWYTGSQAGNYFTHYTATAEL